MLVAYCSLSTNVSVVKIVCVNTVNLIKLILLLKKQLPTIPYGNDSNILLNHSFIQVEMAGIFVVPFVD